MTDRNQTTAGYLFDKEDLAKMALAGNLKECYVLLLGKSIGLRASDFINNRHKNQIRPKHKARLEFISTSEKNLLSTIFRWPKVILSTEKRKVRVRRVTSDLSKLGESISFAFKLGRGDCLKLSDVVLAVASLVLIGFLVDFVLKYSFVLLNSTMSEMLAYGIAFLMA